MIKDWHTRIPRYTNENLKIDLILEWAKLRNFFCAIRQSFIVWDTQDCYSYNC